VLTLSGLPSQETATLVSHVPAASCDWTLETKSLTAPRSRSMIPMDFPQASLAFGELLSGK
jgi:hypothetical protein